MVEVKDLIVASNMIKYHLNFDEESKQFKTYEFEKNSLEIFDGAFSDSSQPDIERLVLLIKKNFNSNLN